VLCSPEEPNKGAATVASLSALLVWEAARSPIISRGKARQGDAAAGAACRRSERWLNGRGVPKEPAYGGLVDRCGPFLVQCLIRVRIRLRCLALRKKRPRRP
jgi:hypothetical protein